MQPTETAGAVPPDDVPTAAHAPRPIRLVQVRAGQRLADRLRNYPGAAPDSGRTLRVALAMRGGVSLAVWIGGAVAELDLLRRIHLYEHGGGILAFVLVTPETPLTAPVPLRGWQILRVDRFVERMYREVHAIKPTVKVGISPFRRVYVQPDRKSVV